MKRKRRSPTRHRVGNHTRRNKPVQSYYRGNGYRSNSQRVVVGRSRKMDYSKIPHKFVKAGVVEVVDGKVIKPEIGKGIYAEWDPDSGMVLIDESLKDLDPRYLENIKRHEWTEMYLATRGIKEPKDYEGGHLAHHIAVMLHPYPESMVEVIERVTGVKPFPIPTNLYISRGVEGIIPAEQGREKVPFNGKCPYCKTYFGRDNLVVTRVYHICSGKICTSDKVYYCPKCGERLFPVGMVERAEDIISFGKGSMMRPSVRHTVRTHTREGKPVRS